MVEFGVHITDAAIGLRRASENKEMWTENTAVLSVIELGKKKTLQRRDFSKNTCTYEYCSSMEKQ